MAESPTPDKSSVAYGAITLLQRAFNRQGLEISQEQNQEYIVETLTQHRQHLSDHSVDQNQVDPFKIICWYGCVVLADSPEEDHERIASALVQTLTGILNLESKGRVILPENTRQLLIQMILAEIRDNPDQGIGKNGVYIGFHCAVETLKCIDNPDSRLANI